MRPQVVTVTATATSAPIPVDWRSENFLIGLYVEKSGTNTYSVEHTYDDIFNPAVTPTWVTKSDMSAQTASKEASYTTPVTAVRLNVTAFTNGSVKLTVLQAG